MRILIVFSFLLCVSGLKAADPKYPVSAIPENLKKDADVVKRMEEISFQVINTGETILHKKYAITILNENGDEYAGISEFYDKLISITSIEGTLYDASGKVLKKTKSKDISDLSAVSGINLIDDSRMKSHHFYFREYPFTVEYEVEQKFNNTLFFPHWNPQEDEKYAVEQSSYTVICPADYSIRYRAFNYKGEPEITMEKGKKKMRWNITSVPAIKLPFASPSWKEMTTLVFFAPSDFEIQGYKGNMSSWKDFGKFQASLNAGRDVLPANITETVNRLTAGITDQREKVRVLYSFLQKNTRYIGIQLGLGGWQPFPANEVATKGYGDCKALTNYMYSLLKAAGIKSNYTLVYAGNNKDVLIEDFPCNRFNHVILCVPLAKDSMWLECTDQNVPAGYMSDFTGNRKALMITDDGGVVVRTPQYGLKENTQLRAIKAKLDEDGNLSMTVKASYGGIEQDEVSSLINGLSKEKVQKVLQKELELSTYDINSFKYDETKDVLPKVDEQLEISVSKYATITGKRLFIVPNILNRGGFVLNDQKDRQFDYVFDNAFRHDDTYEIDIPEGYELESAPAESNLKSKFGTYTSSVKIVGHKVIYNRTREHFAGRYPANEGVALAAFYESVYRSDRSKMVFVKKTSTP
ncbi:MAG TPA: DUF3857 domain-containing protein [Flavisolibacter sp.]|nr:DUF3857 domain-containing protein [Flavisolibacter sp.]